MKTQVSRDVLDQMAHAMRELIRTQEWQIYEGYLLAMLEDKRTALEGSDMDTFMPLQGELRGIRMSLSVPHLIIKEAKKEKKNEEGSFRFTVQPPAGG